MDSYLGLNWDLSLGFLKARVKPKEIATDSEMETMTGKRKPKANNSETEKKTSRNLANT
jgi:hypothetical protein